MPRRRVVWLGAALVVLASGAAVMGRPTPTLTQEATPGAHGLAPPADPLPWRTISWRAAADPRGALAGAGSQRIHRLVATTAGSFVGVGSDHQPLEGRDFGGSDAVWFSPDLDLWQRDRLVAGVPPDSAAGLGLVAAGPAGVVIIGGICCRIEEPAAWRSIDGRGWERSQRATADFGAGQPAALVAWESGFVAVGVSAGQPTAWSSSDGRAWETMLLPAGAPMATGEASDITRTAEGFLAVGRLEIDGSYDAAVWSSVDGRAWRRLADEDAALLGPAESGLHRVVAFAGGVVAFGTSGTRAQRLECERAGRVATTGSRTVFSCGWGDAAAWASPDGKTWLHVPLPEARAPGEPAAQPLTSEPMRAGGPGLLLASETTQAPALFASRDGVRWDLLTPTIPLPKQALVETMLVHGRRVIAAGSLDRGGPSDAGVWIGSVP